VEMYLGIDLGSVSTNFAVVSGDKRLVARRYIRTQGNPIKAIQSGMVMITESLKNLYPDGYEITGVGCTGSARDLAAMVVGADVVKNEITAHAAAARYLVPDVRTVIEIGGQDSKIILLKNGFVTDFAMNTVCAAGTGSFLDNQAERLGIDINDFGAESLKSESPVRIAGRCTVFAESDMIHKQQMGHKREDILAGLCLAMVRNYINNVGLGKDIQRPVIFLGGVAANMGIREAFKRELGYDVIVPENFDIAGAIGVAILTHQIINNDKSFKKSNFYGFGLTEFKYDIVSFDCLECPNICEVVQMSINGKVKARWGDKCGIWKFLGESGKKIPDYAHAATEAKAQEAAASKAAAPAKGAVPAKGECETCATHHEECGVAADDGIERTLICPKCSKEFPALDKGVRPWHTTCGRCGVDGVVE